MRDYKAIVEKLVEEGRKKGVNQVQASVSSGRSFTCEVREGIVEKLEEAGSASMNLKVIKDGKIATASSSDFSEEALKRLLFNAIERAQFSNLDEFGALPDFQPVTNNWESLKIFDPQVESLAPEEKIQTAIELEDICRKDKRIKLSLGSYYSTGISEYYLANSNGFSGYYKTSRYSCGVGLQSGDEGNMYQDGAYESAILMSELPTIDNIASKAISRVLRMTGARKIESQKVPVVLEPRMSASILGFLAGCLSGRSVYMNRTFLAGKLNTRIAGDNITIVDDATIPGRPGSIPFDSEGVPTGKNSIIDQGLLKTYLLDTYSGRKLGLKSTGHASGSTNFILTPGKHSQEEIIRSVDKGLFLVNTIGQGTVPTTGDISKGAYGIWIEKGELSYPVSEITLSGNLGEILNNIEMIGNDPEPRRDISAPTMKIAELTISGK